MVRDRHITRKNQPQTESPTSMGTSGTPGVPLLRRASALNSFEVGPTVALPVDAYAGETRSLSSICVYPGPLFIPFYGYPGQFAVNARLWQPWVRPSPKI